MDRQNNSLLSNWRSCFKFNREPLTDMSVVPYIIVSDFEKSSESDCIKIDNKNERIYNSLLSKALKAEKTIENSGLSMNLEVPIPPHPNNRDRYILWKRRNVCRHVIEQSEAVVFLERNGYRLDEHYEPYQAIELSKSVKKEKGIKEPSKDKSKEFNNIYNNRDKNILRRKSMYGREHRLKPSRYESEDEDSYGFPGIERRYKSNNPSSLPASAPIHPHPHQSYQSHQSHQSHQLHPSEQTYPQNMVQPSAPPSAPSAPPILQEFVSLPQKDHSKPSAPPASRVTSFKKTPDSPISPGSPGSPGSTGSGYYPTLNI